MFYSQNILQKRGGKFGIVWLAATRAVRLNRRDYSSVDVERTCEDIIKYIDLKMAPAKPGQPRPRFSLYLSSQLMYGVVKVYDRQQCYLFGDVTNLCTHFHGLAFPTISIDARPPLASEVTSPDLARLGQFNQPAYDPDFGLLKSPDITLLEDIQTEEFWKMGGALFTPSPRQSFILRDISFPETPKTPKLQPFQPDVGSPLQVSSESITLREAPTEPSLEDIVVPGEVDLPPPGEDLQQQLHVEEERVVPKISVPEDVYALELPIVPEGVTAIPGEEPSLVPITAEDDGRLPPTEETPAVLPDPDAMDLLPRPRLETPGVTPIQVVPATAQASETRKRPSLSPSPIRRRRKRQLLFADREIQLSKASLRQNLLSGSGTCKSYDLPDPKALRVQDLLSRPTCKVFRHPRLIHLWKRNAFTSPHDNMEQEVDEVWCLSPAGRLESSDEIVNGVIAPAEVSEVEMQRLELSRQEQLSIEAIREASMRSAETSRIGELPITPGMDISHPSRESAGSLGVEDMSSERLVDTDSAQKAKRRRLEEEVPEIEQPSFEELGVLPQIPEELEILASPVQPKQVEDVSKAVLFQKDFLMKVSSLTEKEDWIKFVQLCPKKTTSRYVAAKTFAAVLDGCRDGKVEVWQDIPYEDIYISRGDKW